MRKINLSELGWAGFSLVIALLIHFFAPTYLFVQFFKYVALLAFILNLCNAFNIKVPYFSDKKK
tara:strand:- start:620 stop:811 length:192 start_codon:yes stop_codon:yes gene_type:complete